MADDFTCGLVLLAAGASRRMGRPKQLLHVDGQPMARHVAVAVLAAPVAPVVVVLGASAEEISPILSDLPLRVVIHADWSKGMGSSIRIGLATALSLNPQLQGLVVALADQPGLDAAHLGQLLEARRRTGVGIVASSIDGALGPPVLFTAEWFSRLLALDGDAGARSLLHMHPDAVVPVPFDAGADMDTPEDYERLAKRTMSTAQGEIHKISCCR